MSRNGHIQDCGLRQSLWLLSAGWTGVGGESVEAEGPVGEKIQKVSMMACEQEGVGIQGGIMSL